MKKILFFTMAVAVMFSLSSCLEETVPESDSVTAEQISEVASGMESALSGIPAHMQQGYLVYGTQEDETDMAYPGLMIAQTELVGDLYPEGSNPAYDWYINFQTGAYGMDATSINCYLPYRTLYAFIKDANGIIDMIDLDQVTNPEIRAYAGVAYACRAFDYYLLTVLYEPKENIYTDISKVKGLTVPIVTEKTTKEEAIDNPRATHEDMIAFMLADLDKAEECMQDFKPTNRTTPTLATVYGIKAKVYLWDEQYDKAAEYARKAIDEFVTEFDGAPVTEAQIDDLSTGFNTANQAWMWYIHHDAENMRNLANFIGWISSEATWSYSKHTQPSIDKSLYDHMRNSDYRKRWFLHPDRMNFYAYKTSHDAAWLAEQPDYLGLKFRCLNGNYTDYRTGGAVDIPVMRIEEMILIEAEALGVSQGVDAGLTKLNDFMKQYRDPSYKYSTTDVRDFQLEVLKQMRIEFWGEGNAFPSAKRLAPDVIQNYEGTNAPSDIFKMNCRGIKPWWTLVIPDSEENTNRALIGKNNPDPTATVTISTPTPIGEFAVGAYE